MAKKRIDLLENITGGDGNVTKGATSEAGSIGTTIDPAAAAAAAGADKSTGNIDASTGKRKYTKRGETRPSGPQTPLDLSLFNAPLVAINAALANKTGRGEWSMTIEEAEKVTKAASKVLSEYKIEVDPKHQAMVEFFGAIASVYGTRAFTIYVLNRKPVRSGDASE